jgi:hypothetical protein
MLAVPGETLFNEQGKLKLLGANLSVYLYFGRLANTQVNCSDGKFMFRIEDVSAATGYAERSVWYALNYLQGMAARGVEGGYSERREKLIVRVESQECKGRCHMFSISTDYGSPLSRAYGESDDKPCPLRKFLYDKNLGYYDIPSHLMENLKALKGAPLALSLALYQLALDKEQVQFAVSLAELSEKAGVARRSLFKKAWENPEFKRLIHASQLPGSKEAQVTFYHPKKGTSLLGTKSNAAERAYYREIDRPISAYDEQNRDSKKYTADEIRRTILYFFPDAIANDDGELVVDCPECHGTRRGHKAAIETLRIKPDKGDYGVMYCGAYLNRSNKCNYGRQKMPYHLLAARLRIRPGEAQKMFDAYIDELRSGNNGQRSADDGERIAASEKMSLALEELRKRNDPATEDFYRKNRELI